MFKCIVSSVAFGLVMTVSAQVFAQEQSVTSLGREDDVRQEELPEYVEVVSSAVAGSGCRNSKSLSLAEGGRQLTLLTDSFVTVVGPGSVLSESRKVCMATIDLEYPSTWTFAVKSASMLGSIYLESGVAAIVSARSYGAGQQHSVNFENRLSGPKRAHLNFGGAAGDSGLQFMPCGAKRALNLNISTRVSSVRNRAARGYVVLGTDAGLAAKYELIWRRCR